VVIASAWQPRRGRKFELEVQPFITQLNTVINCSIKFPPNLSPRYARPEAGLSDRGIGTGSIHRPNWARQGQCSKTAAEAFGLQLDDDGGGTSEHQPPERPRQTERSGSISAGALEEISWPPQLRDPAEAAGAPERRELGW
jgi:hypothetical protein